MSGLRDANALKATFSANLNYYIKHANMNTAGLAAALCVPFSTVSDWVHGRKYPRMDKVQAIADYFGITKSDLTEERSPLPSGAVPIDLSSCHRIPILGRISAGLPLYAEEHVEGYTLTDLNGGAEYFGLRVQGDSMNALRINDGDIIIVRRQEEVEQGEVAVVLVDEEDATVKRFYCSDTTVTLMPQSTNPEHKPQLYDLSKTSIRVLGTVVKVEFPI